LSVKGERWMKLDVGRNDEKNLFLELNVGKKNHEKGMRRVEIGIGESTEWKNR